MKIFDIVRRALAPALIVGVAASAELKIPEVDLGGLEPSVAEQFKATFADFRAQAEQSESNAEFGLLYGQLGRLFHAYAFAGQAIYCYERAALGMPQEFAWPYLTAVLRAEQGDTTAAIADLRAALALDPNYPPAVVRLAQLYRDAGDLEAAGLVIERLRPQVDQDPSIAAAIGEHELAAGDYEAAADLLLAALDAVPQANRLHYLLAQAYKGLGENRAARNHLKLSGEVGLKPADLLLDQLKDYTSGEILHLLTGHRAYNAGDFQAAVEAFARAVETRPDSLRARVNLAAALGQAGEAAQAMEQFRQVLEQDPVNKTALYNLARLSIAANAYSEADEYYRRLLEINEHDFEAHLERAKLLRALGDNEQALKHLHRAQSDLGTFRQAVLTESEIRVARGELTEALALLDNATGLLPADSEIMLTFANLLATAPGGGRDPQRALETATKVHQHAPSFQSAESIALAHAALNQCAESVGWLEKGIELADGRDDVKRRLTGLRDRVASNSDCRP